MNDTIHPYTDPDPDAPAMFVWQDTDGDLHLLGERHQVASLHAALTAFLAADTLAEPIDSYDHRWGQNYTIAAAVQEALAYGYATDATLAADSIRAACRAGRITGARVVDGKWSIPRRTLRTWLMRRQAETRGRPRKATA